MTGRVQRRQSHHLHCVLPQDGTGIGTSQAKNCNAHLIQKPRHGHGMADMFVGVRTEPANAAPLCSMPNSVIHSCRGIHSVVEPVQLGPQFANAPVVTRVYRVIPDRESGLKHTKSDTRIAVALGRLKSDIHRGIPRHARAFLDGKGKAKDHQHRIKRSGGVGVSAFACLQEKHRTHPLNRGVPPSMVLITKRAAHTNSILVCGSETTAQSLPADEDFK